MDPDSATLEDGEGAALPLSTWLWLPMKAAPEAARRERWCVVEEAAGVESCASCRERSSNLLDPLWTDIDMERLDEEELSTDAMLEGASTDATKCGWAWA